jgi:dihydrodipicolinate synthase/N-acetylneuraminate lyase
MKNEKLKGIIAPITTPFLETGEVNYEGLKSNVQFTPNQVLTAIWHSARTEKTRV